jgi:dihydrofolate reductase
MLIVSKDGRFSEDNKHPNIGSVKDYQRVLAAAKEYPVVMGGNTFRANPRGIPTPWLYIYTRNPASLDLSKLPESQRFSLVRDEFDLPRKALVLGGPSLINTYLSLEYLQLLDLTVSSHSWPNGKQLYLTHKFSVLPGTEVNDCNETTYRLVPNYA